MDSGLPALSRFAAAATTRDLSLARDGGARKLAGLSGALGMEFGTGLRSRGL
jgi:hypothetical protein